MNEWRNIKKKKRNKINKKYTLAWVKSESEKKIKTEKNVFVFVYKSKENDKPKKYVTHFISLLFSNKT